MNQTFLLLALVPLLPLLAAGVTALVPRECRTLAASLVIGTQALACAISLILFFGLVGSGDFSRETFNFPWITLGPGSVLRLGLVLDPLSAGMAAMVSFVALLIFIYSLGYMAEDANFTRFFTFLALFSGAMLGVVLSNSLLLTYASWELVGLASYLLIGFWFTKPEAAAAAKKAFLVTRLGDMGLFVALVWLTLLNGGLFYDNGHGCLESGFIVSLAGQPLAGGFTMADLVALLIFCGAVGKSGQFPLHVWLPDAMEGPTPVSALIHAATMVAAGVFLVARTFPIFSATGLDSSALTVVAATGAFTALFAALIAVAQTDIKRILAYSTVSQLGFMMLALGVGQMAVAMVHLITHAFFKALLFLGAGAVIHGVGGEQDIRKMGNLSRHMPVTFLTYAIGMLALAGFPLFSGFWSKDAILHAAHGWHASHLPYYMALAAAFLTAFYMMRQTIYVFLGVYRGGQHPHESPGVMTFPLGVLAVATLVLGWVATPAWPWMEAFFDGHGAGFDAGALFAADFMRIAATSTAIVFVAFLLAWRVYRRIAVRPTSPIVHLSQSFAKRTHGAVHATAHGHAAADAAIPEEAADPLESAWLTRRLYRALSRRLYVDELYAAAIVRPLNALAALAAWVERRVLDGAVRLVAGLVAALAFLSHQTDRWAINFGFDTACDALREYGGALSRATQGRAQASLRTMALGLGLLIAFLGWLLFSLAS